MWWSFEDPKAKSNLDVCAYEDFFSKKKREKRKREREREKEREKRKEFDISWKNIKIWSNLTETHFSYDLCGVLCICS